MNGYPQDDTYGPAGPPSGEHVPAYQLQPGYPPPPYQPMPGWPSQGWPPQPVAPCVMGWQVHSPPALSQVARIIGWLMLATGVLIVAAAFMPWVAAGPIVVSGIGEGGIGGPKDGVLTLGLAIPIAVMGVIRGSGKAPTAAAIVALVLGGLVSLIAGYDWVSLARLAAVLDLFSVRVGTGLILTLVLGLCAVACGVIGLVKRS